MSAAAAEAAIKEALVACGRSRPDSNFYDGIAKVRVCSLVVARAWPWAGLSMLYVPGLWRNNYNQSQFVDFVLKWSFGGDWGNEGGA